MSLQAIIHIKNMYSHAFSDISVKKLERNQRKNDGNYNFDIPEWFDDTSDGPRRI